MTTSSDPLSETLQLTHPLTKRFRLHAINSVARTDRGRRRAENQDSYGIIEQDNFRFYLIADGMGGARSGGFASYLAVAKVTDALEQIGIKELSVPTLKQAIAEANTEIFTTATSAVEHRGMGTTFCGIGFNRDKFFICNVGDSRAYRLRGGELTCLTQDHTVKAEWIRSGGSAEDNPLTAAHGHYLTRALGPAEVVEIDVEEKHEMPLPGDIFLICSDGLYGMLSEDEIRSVLLEHPLEEAVTILIELANAAGGTDNITVLLIGISENKTAITPTPEECVSVVTQQLVRSSLYVSTSSTVSNETLRSDEIAAAPRSAEPVSKLVLEYPVDIKAANESEANVNVEQGEKKSIFGFGTSVDASSALFGGILGLICTFMAFSAWKPSEAPLTASDRSAVRARWSDAAANIVISTDNNSGIHESGSHESGSADLNTAAGTQGVRSAAEELKKRATFSRQLAALYGLRREIVSATDKQLPEIVSRLNSLSRELGVEQAPLAIAINRPVLNERLSQLIENVLTRYLTSMQRYSGSGPLKVAK